MMKIPLTAEELIKQLAKEFPSKCPRATDFDNKAAEIRMAMYAGKRELIELLLESLTEDTTTLPIMNKKE
jgi:hypothetical protein